MNEPLDPSRWPNIVFTDAGRTRFDQVIAFLFTLRSERHPLEPAIRKELEARLDYLDSYGGEVSDTDQRRRFRVVLGRDWAPLSFSVVWEQLDPKTGDHHHAFSGGLIWHGGTNDPLTVTIKPMWFGIHT